MCLGHFNPRAPCGARRLFFPGVGWIALFQSTRPVRGATPCLAICRRKAHYFNPRAPCGARRDPEHCRPGFWLFQSTRPVRGATAEEYAPKVVSSPFQSTRPVRGATPAPRSPRLRQRISIHAPRAGRDIAAAALRVMPKDFNPRAPCGARPQGPPSRPPCAYFNPRAPCGARRPGPPCRRISRHFNPRAPCGARRGLCGPG